MTAIFLLHSHKQKNLVRRIGNDLANYGSFMNRVENTQLHVNKGSILIEMNVFDKYDSLPAVKQFAFMKYFVSQIRYTLRNLQDYNNYLGYNIKIKASTQSQNYNYISSVVDSKPTNDFEYTSTFSRNGKQIMSFDQFKNKISALNIDVNINETEKEIIDYGENLFNLLTSNGRYYRPENDVQLIEEIVCEKYSLTQEEYFTIYRKAFIFYQ